MSPVTCMITDRRRWPGTSAASEDAWLLSIASAASAGVDLVQVRERDFDGGALLRLTRLAVERVRGTRARILINDRVDVALAGGAHGVHLRADSMPASRVRAIAPAGFLIGRSVHRVDDAVRAWRDGGVDLLVFGHVYDTPSKAGSAPAGTARLREVVEATPIPVLALGGVAVDRFAEVAATGAAGFAAIGLFAGANTTGTRDMLRLARDAFRRR